jgi:type IV secretory pathway VirB3-like protein
MHGSGRAGEMPIFQGALRAKLIMGVDERVGLLVVILVLFGIVQPLLFLVAAGVFGIGRIVGAVSPYFFDELSRYAEWRLFSWSGSMPDDSYWTSREPKFRRTFRKAKT